MSLFGSIAKIFTGDKTKGLTQDDVLRILGEKKTGEEVFPDYSDAKLLKTTNNNAIVYSCVNTLSRSFQEAPLILEKQNSDGTWEQVEESPLLEPFFGNPDLSASEIGQYLVMHLELTGKYFLWKWKSPDGMTREVWPVPPSWVKVNPVKEISPDPKAQRLIESFTVKVQDGTEYRVPTEDMAYGSKKPLTPNQKSDLRAALRRKIGKDARDNAILISGDEASIEMLNPMSGFDWESYTAINETRICMVFGVPPVVIGALVGLENSPWSNTGEARRWMYRNTLAGLWEMIATNHNRDFIPKELQATLRFCYCTDEVQELQEDVTERATRAKDLFRAGILTREEAREILGYDAVPETGVFIYALSDVLTDAGEDFGMGADVAPLSPEEQAEGVEMMSDENSQGDNRGSGPAGTA